MNLFVPGIPRPFSRPRVNTKRGTVQLFQSKLYRQWRETLSIHFRAMRAQGHWYAEQELAVSLEFRLPDRRRRDLDNLQKGVLDAGNKVIWQDDSQIGNIHAVRIYACKSPGVMIETKAWDW